MASALECRCGSEASSWQSVEWHMDSSGARLLNSFGFPDQELRHSDHVVETYGELVQLLSRVMRDTNEGFAFVSGLPSLEHHDKRTLMAALLTRSFKFTNCAIQAGIRGYYSQCTTLVRCVVVNVHRLLPVVCSR
jgi:hypothetical protein